MLVGTYNPWLVAISLLVAVMASYTALAMAGRTVTAPGKGAAWWWRLGGGFAMGLGIWSMHFIGMLAFDLPIPLGYDLPITLLSLALAIASSVFALWLVSLRTLPHPPGRRRAADGHRHCRHALRRHGGDAHAAGHRLRPGLAAVLADGGGGRLVDRAVRGVPPARAAHRVGDRLAAPACSGWPSSACTTPAWPPHAFRKAASAARRSAMACRTSGWRCWWWC
jgi:hypothetical protein